ncbi:cation transporter [Bdellovibrio sp. SKB1291214]|uniref:heavy-metal-associated domain-containing protein n=1 Tax=Bdellovibrio sp. SKB1291214 TaxID=1732569 RepID=UPI000B5196AC|nr:heavy-metal-associated domain-containing protein [Bdellovibrio sp. SKB1291214]UYL08276.1 cation transporter [Bdellovibrio sp. SKB1291214]
MKNIILTIALIMSSVAFAAETETVGVKGMVCSFCAQGITKKFKEQPEVSNVEVSLEKKYVKLTYNDGKKLSHEKIETLLKDAGYEVSFDKK